MQQKAWSAKRERQYAHIKDGLLESGKPQSVAEEIAARGRQQGTGAAR
jgi:hypothetical protein